MRVDAAAALVAAVDQAIAPWVERCVARIMTAYRGEVPAEVGDEARTAGEDARRQVVPALRALLERDVDEQWTSPLSLVRGAVRFPTAVLQAAGIPEVRRDEFQERMFPDDPYGLVPKSWRDIDPALHEPGLVWGAWKAKTVLERRRPPS
jgi:hypothetical protein